MSVVIAFTAAANAQVTHNSILLNTGHLDTSTAEVQSLRKPVESFAGKRLHLVQFAGPIKPEWRDALLAIGARIVNYIPNNAYLVYGDAPSLARLQNFAAREFLRWDADYADNYKIQSGARAATNDLFYVQLVNDPEANAVTIPLLSLAKNPRQVLDFINLTAHIAPTELARVASRPDVISIEAVFPAQKMDERLDQIVAGHLSSNTPVGPGYLQWLESLGFSQQQFDASGFIIDVADSGIDNGTLAPNHFGLYTWGNTNEESRLAYARLIGSPNAGSTLKGCDGHGTINAHIAAGFDDNTNFPFADASGFAYGLGVCPFARLGSSVIFDPDNWTSPDFTTLESTAYQSGARIDNDSWGYSGSGGGYGIVAQEFDALVRDCQPNGATFAAPGNQEMTIVFAAGDSGPQAGSIVQPSTAKNVISVGGADNVQPFGAPDECGVGDNQAVSANEIASFSARGPCTDGRHKPDLVAPSTHVTGGVVQTTDPGPLGNADSCFTGDSVCGGVNSIYYPAGQEFYTASSGTSHSAPAVAGACALLRQYFINTGFNAPSPAMTKAHLMNSARYLNGTTAGGTLWSDTQGMGELNPGSAFDGVPRILRDELSVDTFSATGQQRTFAGTVANTNLPFRVTLAWTDAPGSTTGSAYNNDLDLTVTVGGQTYFGNVFNGAWSTGGGAADVANNVESVFIPAGVSGPFTVTLTAANINSVGVPNSSNALSQDFALVINNAVGAGSAQVVWQNTALASENCPPANGVIDPDETVTVNFSLQNLDTVPTTNLVATLLAGNGIELPSAPVSFGVLQPGGAAVTRPFTFTASGACGSGISAVIQLTDGASFLETVTNHFILGAFVPNVIFSENFDGSSPPALPISWITFSEGGQPVWITTNVDNNLPNSAFAKASTNAGISDLVSPAIPISTTNAQLQFRNYFSLETNAEPPFEAFDGGVLDIQIGTNAFTEIISAGGKFLTNGYNQTIAPSTVDDNPLANRSCWSGNSYGFVTTIAQLPPSAAGQSVQFKWRCATDTGNANGSVGWWIDTVSLLDGGSYECCNGVEFPTLINPHTDGGNFIFLFQSGAAQTYVIEIATNLSNHSWTPLETLSGNGGMITVTNRVGASAAFYRVRSNNTP